MTAALVGLGGFRLLAAGEVGGELELLVETVVDLVGCPACGAVARAKDRRPRWVRDLPLAGRAVELCWVEAGVVLPATALRAEDLDRTAPGGRATGGVDRAGPAVGLRAGRRARRRGLAGGHRTRGG